MTTKHLSGYYCDSYTLTAGFSKLVIDRTAGVVQAALGLHAYAVDATSVPVAAWNRACLDVGMPDRGFVNHSSIYRCFAILLMAGGSREIAAREMADLKSTRRAAYFLTCAFGLTILVGRACTNHISRG